MREQKREFAEVLAEAQKLGYAEADPSFDIDGIDAAHKLAILAALAFGRPVDFGAVHVEGIRDVSRARHRVGRGARLPHQAAGHRAAGRRRASSTRVHPCMVPVAAPIARVDGVFNAVVAEGDFVGRVVLEGRGAGAGPTASAVVADLIDIARGPAHAGLGRGGGGAGRDALGADGPARRRLLPAPDGGGPARRDRRRDRACCATTGSRWNPCCSAAARRARRCRWCWSRMMRGSGDARGAGAHRAPWAPCWSSRR